MRLINGSIRTRVLSSSGQARPARQGFFRRTGTAALALGTFAAAGMIFGPVSPAAAATTAQDVIDAFASGGQLTLDQDVTVSQGLSLAVGLALTIDLGGHELTIATPNGPAGPFDPAETFGRIPVINQGTLTLKNGTVQALGGDGGAGASSPTPGTPGGFGAPAFYNLNGATMILDGADLTGQAGQGGDGGTASGAPGGDGGNGAPGMANLGSLILYGAGSTVTVSGSTGGAGGAGAPAGSDGLDGADWVGNSNFINLDGNGADAPSTVTVYTDDLGTAQEALDQITPAWPLWAGHPFVGWFDAASGGTEVGDTTAAANQTIYAQWTDLSSCNATTVAYQLGSATDGSTVTLCGDVTIAATDNPIQTPPNVGFTFDLSGHSLTVTGPDFESGLVVGADGTLTIEDSGSGGSLTATGGQQGAGIGLGPRYEIATLIINGGTITANGGSSSTAGIGGGAGDNGGPVIINGGTVYANGNDYGPGIGGSGGNSMVGNHPTPITINGGEVHATGGTGLGGGMDTDAQVTINGGIVFATGTSAGGISSGSYASATNVTITGGVIDARGGTGGPGIGGWGATVVDISGGTIVSEGGRLGAGIGTGLYSPSDPTITISGDADVTAIGGPGAAGIGGGYGSGFGGSDGDGGAITIAGGTVTATTNADPSEPTEWGAAIGGGAGGDGGTVTIGANAVVNVYSEAGSAFGAGSENTDFGLPASIWGSLTNNGTINLLAGADLQIPAGVTVVNDGKITGPGAITGLGTVDNGGSITHTVDVGVDPTILDHNFDVSFDANGGTGAPATMRLYSETFSGAELSLADLADPVLVGQPFSGWYPASPPAGLPLADASSISSASSNGTPIGVTLYAGWNVPPPCDETTFAADFNGAANGSTVTLCGNITIDATDNLPLAVPAGNSVTLDLAGYTLTVTAPDGAAGIAVPAGAALTFVGTGAAHATGGDGAAGIGGDVGVDAGSVSINAGSVTATAGSGAAGIGGGAGGSGGSVTIAAGATVSAVSDTGNTIGHGAGGASFGSLTNNGTLTFNTAGTFVIPTGVTVVNNGTLNNNGITSGTGGFGGVGGIVNSGSIRHTITVASTLTVTLNNYELTFDVAGGTGSAPARSVYARTLEGAGLTTADLPVLTRLGYTFGGWLLGPAPAGLITIAAVGDPIADDTELSALVSSGTPVDVPLYAAWDAIPTQIDTSSLPTGEVGLGYSTTLAASGGTGSYTWSVTVGALPDGLNLHPTTGVLDGTPVVEGIFTFSVTAASGNGTEDVRELTLAVVPGPSVVTSALPDGEVSVDYTAILAATGGVGEYLWSVTAGSLPDGLGLDEATGEISGTPSTSGPASFTVTVADENGVTASRQFTIFIAAPVSTTEPTTTVPTTTEPTTTVPTTTEPTTTVPTTTAPTNTEPTTTGPTTTGPTTTGPTTTRPTTTPLMVVTVTLPDPTAGTPYQTTLTVTGGTDTTHTWAIIGGTLPPGLSLSADGVISGTPTQAGTFTFTVSVDGSATAQLTLTVQLPRPALPATGTPDWLVSVGIIGLILLAGGGLILGVARRRGPRQH